MRRFIYYLTRNVFAVIMLDSHSTGSVHFAPDENDRPSEQSNDLLIINLQYVTVFINTFLASTLKCMFMIFKVIKFCF